jgi:hypothetical protein
MDYLLILGASARATRFVTTDDLGQWWIANPLRRRFADHPRWGRYLSGLECPFCAGFHVSLFAVTSYAIARSAGPRALAFWRIGAGALTVNYVSAHADIRLTDD